MNKADFHMSSSGLDGNLTFISAVTDLASPNREFEVHAHYNEFEIYYFLKGDLSFAFEGKQYAVQEGSMVIIAPDTLHRPLIRSQCRYHRKRILFSNKIFSDSYAMSLSEILQKRRIMLINKEKTEALQLASLFEQIGDLLAKGTEYEAFCALISLFSFLIKAEKTGEREEVSVIYSGNSKISEIVKYIEENISEDLSYKTISKKFFVTEKYLYKLFKKETGFTLSNYINERRIIKAQSVLNAGGTANEAAAASGFSDYSVFYRSFLRKVGIPPSQYVKGI